MLGTSMGLDVPVGLGDGDVVEDVESDGDASDPDAHPPRIAATKSAVGSRRRGRVIDRGLSPY